MPCKRRGVDERHLFEDRASGSRDDRAGLATAMAFLEPGDCLAVFDPRPSARKSLRRRLDPERTVTAFLDHRQLGAYPGAERHRFGIARARPAERTLFTPRGLTTRSCAATRAASRTRAKSRTACACRLLHGSAKSATGPMRNQQHRASGLILLVSAITLGTPAILSRVVAALRELRMSPITFSPTCRRSVGSTPISPATTYGRLPTRQRKTMTASGRSGPLQISALLRRDFAGCPATPTKMRVSLVLAILVISDVTLTSLRLMAHRSTIRG